MPPFRKTSLYECFDREQIDHPYRVDTPLPLPESQKYCERLAKSHYENFLVAGVFCPKPLRQHFYNVYAYCRISDDLGDEIGDTEKSLILLDWWEDGTGRDVPGRAAPSRLCRLAGDGASVCHSRRAVP